MPDRVAIITGAGSGIGRAIATRLASEHITVVLAEIASERGQEVERVIANAGGTALHITTDVTSASSVREMLDQTVRRFGGVDILVNNAGTSRAHAEGRFDLLHTNETLWDGEVQMFLKSVYLCTRAALPTLIRSGQGSIVNISSINALTAVALDAYSAAKAGVLSLTRTIAASYGARGIRANAICAGSVRTEVWDSTAARVNLERLKALTPIGRLIEPADIAHAVAFLVSDAASAITGTTITVDGGLSGSAIRSALTLLATDPAREGTP